MKKTKRLLFAVLLMILVLLTAYLALAFYYRDSFSLNTWINGVYCTGKTVEEVNSELLAQTEAPIFCIRDKEGDEYLIPLEWVGYQADYAPVLIRYREEQNPYLWIDNIVSRLHPEIHPAVMVDEDLLQSEFDNLEFVLQERARVQDYSLVQDPEKGYVFTDGLIDRIDLEKAYRALAEKVTAGENCLDLAEAGCYYDVSPNETQKSLRILWKEIETYQNCDIVYCFGEDRHPLTAADCAGFLQKENGLPIREGGSFVLDPEAVAAYVEQLAALYDGYGRTREFHSTRGDVVTIEGNGTYGSKMDQKKEVEYLMRHLLDDGVHTGTVQTHIPSYERQAFCYGRNDIGDTYIEVDMTEQKMYYYENGERKLETDIVTGNMKRRMGTPEGVNFVYNKQRDRVLRGPGYASPVKFWMPVKGGIGIHDAGWRKEFGGEIYKTTGSHGCINTPRDKMEELYDMVQVGTPVVMFY